MIVYMKAISTRIRLAIALAIVGSIVGMLYPQVSEFMNPEPSCAGWCFNIRAALDQIIGLLLWILIAGAALGVGVSSLRSEVRYAKTSVALAAGSLVVPMLWLLAFWLAA